MPTVSMELGGRTLTIETGRVARQASGSVLVRYGDTVVLCTAVVSRRETDRDFLPLLVDYREKTYAAGRIPGGFFKREGRPTEKEILSSRLIDRSLRPLFDQSNRYDTMIGAEVLSHDQLNDGDTLGLIGGSCALNLSDLPFPGPVGAMRLGLGPDGFLINPTAEEVEFSRMNIVIAGTEDSIVMVEGEAREISEETLIEAFRFAHPHIQQIVRLQQQLISAEGKAKRDWTPKEADPEILKAVFTEYKEGVSRAIRVAVKQDREAAVEALADEAAARFADTFPEREAEIRSVFHDLEKQLMRRMILEEGARADGRGLTDIRPISCEIGVLPRTHGSAIFTRGQTQALVVVTLGTSTDEQKIEELMGQSWKTFMLHYNFPSYSVGEVRPNRGPGRREIGHGALAERALSGVVPSNERFPYTIRIVSDVLESNGSSSMATVCGSSLAMMDAGIPTTGAVSGIAMGLIKEGGDFAVLSDILGDEDHLGDMDFKVAGTKNGVTAIQMDIKIGGVDRDIMLTALRQAREGRLFILDRMNEVLSEHRAELSPFAPRIYVMMVKPDKIREIIGPGGKVIRGIQEQTGVKIDIEDDGTVKIAAVDADSARAAITIIEGIAQVPEVGKVYQGRVRKIMEFGAFVEIFPGTDGLLHVSQISKHRVNASECFKEGDEVTVRVLEVDRDGKIRLSHKEFEEEGRFKPATGPAPGSEKAPGSGRERERDRDRGRGGPRGRR